MKAVFSEGFIDNVKCFKGQDAAAIRAAVDAILKDPFAKAERPAGSPRIGSFEIRWGYFIINYGICGECRKLGIDQYHMECCNHDDDTVVFRGVRVPPL